MRLHFATIPALDPATAERELDQFLSTHRILGIERHFLRDERVWAVCVTYTVAESPKGKRTGRGPKVDYLEVLGPTLFPQYAGLRETRKALAAEAGVPPYAVLTNEQLAAFVRLDDPSLAALGAIPGVGPSRVKSYGEALLARLNALRGDDAAT